MSKEDEPVGLVEALGGLELVWAGGSPGRVEEPVWAGGSPGRVEEPVWAGGSPGWVEKPVWAGENPGRADGGASVGWWEPRAGR